MTTEQEFPTAPILFASTRVVLRPHIGTFFGWIKPLARQAQSHNVTVLLCDLQSFDGTDLPSVRDIDTFRNQLLRYLPASVQILVEREIYGIEALIPLILRGIGTRALTRNPTLKALATRGALRLGHLVYPALMAADILACRPDLILAREDGYRTFEWPFKAVRKLSDLIGLVEATPRPLGFPQVQIVDDDGERLRRSVSGGPQIGESPDDTNAVERWILARQLQPDGPGAVRWARCRAPKSLWQSLPESAAPCQTTDTSSCGDCLFRLCDRVRAQLVGFSSGSGCKSHPRIGEAASAANERISRIFRSWLPMKRSELSKRADAAAFIPADLAASELAGWIILSFARRSLIRSKRGRLRLDVVLLATTLGTCPSPPRETIAQLTLLQRVAALHGIEWRIVTPDQVLEPASLASRLYGIPITGAWDETVGTLVHRVDSGVFNVLHDRYEEADRVDFGPDRASPGRRISARRFATKLREPIVLDGGRLLEPVFGRLYRPFAKVIQKYPTADAAMSKVDTVERFRDLYTMSTAWWNPTCTKQDASSNYATMKDRIVQSYREKCNIA